MKVSKVLVSAAAAVVFGSLGFAYAQSPSPSQPSRSPNPSGAPNDPGLPGNPVGPTGSVQTQSQATPPAGQPGDGMQTQRQRSRSAEGSPSTARSTTDTPSMSGERPARADRN